MGVVLSCQGPDHGRVGAGVDVDVCPAERDGAGGGIGGNDRGPCPNRERAHAVVARAVGLDVRRKRDRPRAGFHDGAAIDGEVAGRFQVYVAVGAEGVDPCNLDGAGAGGDAAYAGVEITNHGQA